jgi:uncharacterized protein (DUF1697 family)
MTRYVALLHGINVGGKNLIRMTDLRACFERLGFADVATYIQSGNVVFGATGASAALTRRIERAVAGPGVLYCSRLIAKASRSRLSKIASLSVYKRVTVRNWNTATKLLEML